MGDYFFNPYAIPTFAASAAFLFISVYRVIRDKFSFLSGLFSLISLLVFVWLFSFSWMYCAPNERSALWWAKVAYIAIPLLPSAIYHFTLIFLQIYRRNKILVRLSWAFSIFFSLLAINTNLIIGGVKHYHWGYYPQYEVFSIPYLMFFFGIFVLSMHHLITEYRKAVKGTAHSRRIKSFIIALGIASLAVIDYIPKFGINIYPFGYIPILACLLIFSVTISRYRLVDITPAFTAEKIIDTMNDILFVTDPEGIIRLVNKAALTSFGVFEDDLIGRHITQVIDNAFFSNQFENLLKSEPVNNFEISCRPRKDMERILTLSIAAIKDKAKRSLAIVIIAKDITYLKLAERDIVREKLSRNLSEKRPG